MNAWCGEMIMKIGSVFYSFLFSVIDRLRHRAATSVALAAVTLPSSGLTSDESPKLGVMSETLTPNTRWRVQAINVGRAKELSFPLQKMIKKYLINLV